MLLSHQTTPLLLLTPTKWGRGTRSWSLWKETESLFSLAITLNISICARFISGRMNMVSTQGHRQPHLPTMGSSQPRPFCHKCIKGYKTVIPDLLSLPLGLMLDKIHSSSTFSSPFSGKDSGLFNLCSLGTCQQPFEPMSEIPLKLLMLKTVFLTLLASGARRGEIHALAYLIVTPAPNWNNIVLCPIPGFISKTLLQTKEFLLRNPLPSPLLAIP